MSFLFNEMDAWDAYYIFSEYLADDDAPAFDPDELPNMNYLPDTYVILEQIGEDKKVYYSTDEILDMLNNPACDGYTGQFGHDEAGFYELCTAPQGYRVVDWTDEMKNWIAAHQSELEDEDEG